MRTKNWGALDRVHRTAALCARKAVHARQRLAGGPRWVERAVLIGGFALVLLAFLPPGTASLDGASMLAVTRALVNHASVSVPCSFGVVGRGGSCYSTFYPLNSILAAPFFAAGEAIGDLAHISATFVGNAMAQVVPALSAAVAAALTVSFSRRLGASPRRALLAGLTLIFATEMAVLERTFYAEALLTALIAIQVWLFARPRSNSVLLPVVVALTILAKPQAFLVAPLLALEVALRTRTWRPAMLTAVGTTVGGLLYGVYDDLRFSSFTNLGGSARTLHSSAFAATKLIKAIGLLTVSPGRGLLVFSPICILGLLVCLRRRGDPLARAALIIPVGLLLVYMGNPGSGFNWASRYLAPALPLFVAAAWAAQGKCQIAAGILSLIGAVIEFPTFVGYYERYYLEASQHHRLPAQLYWSVVHSPLVGVWGSMVREINDAATTNLHALVTTNVAGSGVEAQRFFHVISEWWWLLPVAHIPRPVGVLATLILVGLGGLLLWTWGGGQRGTTIALPR